MLNVDRARLREAKVDCKFVPLGSLLTDCTPAAAARGLRWRGWYGNTEAELPAFSIYEVVAMFGVRLSLMPECHEEQALPAGPIGITSMASSILSSSSTVRESGRCALDIDEEPEEDSGEDERERRPGNTGSDRSFISSNIS